MSDRGRQEGSSLTWLDTDAGALVLLPASLRPLWSGVNAPLDGRRIEATFRLDPSGPVTDYDRACDVEGVVGLLEVGPGTAVVLGEEPLPTTWQALPAGGGLLARVYTYEGKGYPTSLPALPRDLVWETVGELVTDGSPLVLFDSTEPGTEAPVFPSLPVELTAGRYAVERSTFANAQVELWLVRLRPLPEVVPGCAV